MKVHGVDIVGDGVCHANLSTANCNRDMVAKVPAAADRLDIPALIPDVSLSRHPI